MTTPGVAESPSQQAVVDAALLMLRQMGLSPDELVAVPRDRAPVPASPVLIGHQSEPAARTDGTSCRR